MPYASTDRVFKAISDPTRRAILDRLRAGGRPAGEIASGFAVSRPAISQHLRVLREAGLVDERRDGRRRVYALVGETLETVDDWLQAYRRSWQRNLESLKAYVEEEEGSKNG